MSSTDSASLNLIKMCKLVLIPILYRDNLITDIMKTDENFSKINIVDWYIDLSPLKDTTIIIPKPTMFNLKIQYKIDDEILDKTLQLKVPKLSYSYDKFGEYGVDEGEYLVYSQVLTEMRKLDNDDFTQNYYLGDKFEHWMVLEDWQSSDYKAVSRSEQLDLEHSKLVFKYLAKFHALSVKLNDMSLIPEKVKRLNIDHENPEDQERARAYYRQGLDYFIENLDPKLREKYSKKLNEMKDKMIDTLAADLRCDSTDTFKVLNLGQFTKHNTVFKYTEDNVVEKIKIHGFLNTGWMSPAFNILDVAVSSIKFEVFEEHFDSLLEIYSNTLNEILKSYGLNEYKIEDLRKDVDKQYTYGFWVCGLILPLIVNPTEYVNFSPFSTQIHDDEANQVEPPVQYSTMADTYGNDKYKDLASKWFMHYVKKGIFDD